MLAQRLKPKIDNVPGVDKAAQTMQKRMDDERAAKKAKADQYLQEHNYGNIEIPKIEGSAGLPAKEDVPGADFKETVERPNTFGDFLDKQREQAIANAQSPETRYDMAGSTLEKANQEGLAASRAIQNAEIPKWKRMTINDVLFNPEYQGIRDSIAGEAVRARGANFAKGLAGKDGNYTSAIDNFNNTQAERYNEAVADRDTRALDAQLQADEAANKRDVGEVLQRADTKVGRELDRWGLLYDTETKKQVLDRMVQDSKTFQEELPNPEDRLMLTAYQQYLSGDATALDSIISTYGTQVLDKLSDLVDRVVSKLGGDNNTKPPIKIGSLSLTEDQIKNMGWQEIDKLIQSYSPEEQDRIISDFEMNYGKKYGSDKLRNEYNGRQKVSAAEDERRKQSDERADTLDEYVKDIVDNYSGKEREQKLKDTIDQLDRDMSVGDIVETTKLATARANAEKELRLAQLSNTVVGVNKPLQNNVKLKVDNNGNLDTKSAENSLDYLANKVDWTTLVSKNTQSVTDPIQKKNAVRGTEGYKTVTDFLSNPKVQAYVSNSKNEAAREKYKKAVQKIISYFGGSAKDYGFYQF